MIRLWYIARFDVNTSRYYLRGVSANSGIDVYHWIKNRYRAMFFYTELSVGGYINTYLINPREDIELGIVCFENGEESKTIPLLDFSRNYTNILRQVIIT